MIRNVLRRIQIMAMSMLALAAFAAATTTPQLAPVRISGERRVNFDANWRFYKAQS